MNIQELIETIQWGPEKKVETKGGPKLLKKANADSTFWNAWKTAKEDLKKVGISCGKDRQGNWEVCWWKDAEINVKAIEESRAVDADIDIPAPEGLEYLPFQKAGIQCASQRPNTLIADEMGLGKTIQALGAINADSSIKTVLVICPASLRLNWRNEARKWLTRNFNITVLSSKDRFPENPQFVIVNYDIVSKFPELFEREWDTLIVDEAHYLKNSKAKRTKLILGE